MEKLKAEDLLKTEIVKYCIASQPMAEKGSKGIDVHVSLRTKKVWFSVYSGSLWVGDCGSVTDAVELFNKTEPSITTATSGGFICPTK